MNDTHDTQQQPQHPRLASSAALVAALRQNDTHDTQNEPQQQPDTDTQSDTHTENADHDQPLPDTDSNADTDQPAAA